MNHFKALNKKIFLVCRLKSLFLQVWLSTAETQRQSGTSTPTQLESRCSKLFLTCRTKEATLWQVIERWPNQWPLMELPPTRFYYFKKEQVLWKNMLNVDLVILLPVALFSFSNDCIHYCGGEALVPRRSNWVFVSDAQEWLLTTSSRTTSEPTLGCVQKPAKSESW